MKSNLQWWTWDPERPASVSNRQYGLTLTPVLYSAKKDEASIIDPSNDIEYGYRSFDGSLFTFETKFSDTVISWKYLHNEQGDLCIKWSCKEFGEWGLRYWVSICLEGSEWRYDETEQKVFGKIGEKNALVRLTTNPLMVTGHTSIEALVDEFNEKGYFYLNSRVDKGNMLALRYNLEEMPSGSLTISTSEEKNPSSLRDDKKNIGSSSGPQKSLQAIYDVISWNHVYDTINNRPYTCLSRNWNTKKFGGFGVWLNDVLFNAMLWSFFDKQKAIENLEAVVAWQTDEGNYSCLVTGNDQWVDRSQPPIAAWVLWNIWQRSNDDEILKRFYPSVLKNHEWFHRKRTLGSTGLVSYGTSTEIGSGLYKGTKLGAKNESSMDNSPVHDEAQFNPATGLLESADVGLNSLLCLDGELLGSIALHLGDDKKSNELKDRVDKHKEKISEWLWDDSRGVFANRLLDGSFVRPLAPTSFYPLIAGAASSSQQESLVNNYLLNEEKFGGEFVLPSVSRDDPSYKENVYWRGRVWGPLNYWTYLGLKRSSLFKEASWLAEKSNELFMKGWEQRLCGENYNADNGEIKDQSDTDEFYSWGALMPSMNLTEIISQNPWQGTSINFNADFEKIGPVLSSLGIIILENQTDLWTMDIQDKIRISGNVKTLIYNLSLKDESISFELNQIQDNWYLEFTKNIHEARQNRDLLRIDEKKITFEKSVEPQSIEITFR